MHLHIHSKEMNAERGAVNKEIILFLGQASGNLLSFS